MCILCILAGRQLDSVNTVEMPDPVSTFVLPLQFQKRDDIFSELVDWDCVGYISKSLQEKIPDVIIPLRTTGDGNCLLHALSRAVWGTEIYCDVLRAKMFEELQQHHDWYKANSKYEEKEFETAVAFAGQPGAHLSFLHVLALSNLIKRPITIYAGDEDIERFGTGEGGVAGTVLPTRVKPEEVKGGNIALAWSSAVKNHYVPVITLEGRSFEFPVLDIAFKESIPAGVDPAAYIKKSEILIRSEFAEMLEKNRGDFTGGVTRESLQRAMLQMSGEDSPAAETNDDVVKQYMLLLQARMEQRRREQAEEWMRRLVAASSRGSQQSQRRPKRAYYVPEANVIITDQGDDDDDDDEDDDGYDDEFDQDERFFDASTKAENRRRKIRKLTENMSEEDRMAIDQDEELQEALLQREELRRQMINLQTYVKLQKLQQQMQEQRMRQSGEVHKPTPEDEARAQKLNQANQLLKVLQAVTETSPRKEKPAARPVSPTPPPVAAPAATAAPPSPTKQADIVMTLNLKNNMNVTQQVKIHYNHGDDPVKLARDVIWSQGISEDKYLAKITEFIKNTVAQRTQKRSSSLEPPAGGQAAPVSTPVSPLASPRLKHLPYSGEPIKFYRTGNVSLAVDKLLQFTNELKPSSPLAALSDNETARLGDVASILQGDQYQTATLSPQHVGLFIRILVDWPTDRLFPAVDLFRIMILYNSAAEKLQNHAQAFEKILQTVSDPNSPRPLRLTAMKLFANFIADQRFNKLHQDLEHKVVDAIVASAQDDNKNVGTAVISLILNLSLSWSRSTVSDLAKLRVLDAAVLIIKRLVAGEPAEELRMLLVAVGTILFGRVQLIEAFKHRVNISSILGNLAPTWQEAIREVAAELVEICK
eukprot:TRINITY_DN12077_c0_g1_i1.p1 TRINITY_DN12077_c0_g1~~TRINITY_DN12077_c0_g1_i1.p1  ORF type:complete len:876 (-),score=199.09 TRINITY_DN12077_c0_g1_i1:2-2629(-)